MQRPLVKAVPSGLFALAAVFELIAVVLSWGLEPAFDTVFYAVWTLSMAGLGALIARRHPANPIGWIFCWFALINAITSDAAQGWMLRSATAGWPGTDAAQIVVSMSWLVSGFGWTLTLLLFPDGHLLSDRWRALPWIGAIGTGLAIPGWVLSPARDQDFPSGRNPIAVDALPTGLMLAVGMTLFLGALAASVIALVLRFRRSHGIERLQLKWCAWAAGVAGVLLPLSFALWNVSRGLAAVFAATALVTLMFATGLAILRYRLYDIDILIDATVVYGTVTVMLGAAYAGITLSLGTTAGRGSGWVTAAATLAVAIAFRPLRSRVQDAVDRRFHRARYHAVHRMADFLDALRAGRAEPEDVQAHLRELLADPRLDVLLFLPASELYVDVHGDPAQPDGDARQRIPIERGGQPLGMVRHESPLREDPALIRGVVEAAGLAIEITRLRVELRRQLVEVQASRARIVAAANEERRRIERDLHDGAQQRLVSIGLALRHAQHEMSTATPELAALTIDDAVAEVTATIDELRELARGLPPAQLDSGLAPAFQDLARRAPVPVQVQVPSRRFDRTIEGAAYFIGCEGVTNAVKHAQATRIAISAGQQDGHLILTVTDDGVGGAGPLPGSGLSGLADRVAALGGVLRIDSPPGAGTTLTAELPCAS